MGIDNFEHESIFPLWDSKEEKDMYYEIMRENDEWERKLREEELRINERILKAVQNFNTSEWLEDLKKYMEESEVNGTFKIVRKPQGQKQKENYEHLTEVWVNQSTSYPCEDCYYGTVTVEIKPGRWLEMPFSC